MSTFNTILIVDDVLENLQLLSIMLTKVGLQVRATKSGKEALSSVTSSPPDIILLDINLPDMNGFEVCRQLKDNILTASIPIMFITGLNDVDEKLKAFSMGAVDYITKPFVPQEVIARIQNHLYTNKLQSDLKLSEKKHRLLFDASRDALNIIEPPRWNFTSANLATLKMFGANTEAEFISRPPWFYSPPTQPSGIASDVKAKGLIEKTLNHGTCLFEWNHKRLNGEVFPATVLLTKVVLEEKEFIYATIRDITIEKELKHKRDQMRAQLFQSSKLATLGTFASGIAHEINNPLAIISGQCELMQMQLAEKDDPIENKKLQVMQNATERIAAIINGLRVFARHDTTELEKVDIHQCINQTIGLVRTMYEKRNIKIKTEFHAENIFLNSNKGQMQEVLLNMLDNAKDALSKVKEGVITIKTENIKEGVSIEINDNGSGMTKEVLAKLFDPFFTTKAPGKGTGVGLTSAHFLVEYFNGNITVKSTVDVGTTFTIFLPQV